MANQTIKLGGGLRQVYFLEKNNNFSSSISILLFYKVLLSFVVSCKVPYKSGLKGILNRLCCVYFDLLLNNKVNKTTKYGTRYFLIEYTSC